MAIGRLADANYKLSLVETVHVEAVVDASHKLEAVSDEAAVVEGGKLKAEFAKRRELRQAKCVDVTKEMIVDIL